MIHSENSPEKHSPEKHIKRPKNLMFLDYNRNSSNGRRPWYSNESQRTNKDIYNDFKLKKTPLVEILFHKLTQRFNPLTAKLFNLNFNPLEVMSR